MDSFHNGGNSRPEQAISNLSAHIMLKGLTNKGAQLHLTFGISEMDRIPYVNVESEKVGKFKYQLNRESLKALLNYCLYGDFEDVLINPEKVRPFGGKLSLMLLAILQICVRHRQSGGEIYIKKAPIPEHSSQYIALSICTIFTDIYLHLERTEELQSYLSENDLSY